MTWWTLLAFVVGSWVGFGLCALLAAGARADEVMERHGRSYEDV